MAKPRPGVEFLEVPESPFRVPEDKKLEIERFATKPPRRAPDDKRCKRELPGLVEEIAELQRTLYASDGHALLCVFQAMDAAGKDSTIRKVFSGVNPAGFQVFSFKAPSKEELDHDFLWRTTSRLPERGRIGVFNRSYYEEVLVVKVHPGFLAGQRLPQPRDDRRIWQQRYESIRDHELHLVRNGTVVLKFWLNVSQREQHRRFLDRLNTPRKRWKFSERDLDESALWPKYMRAYRDVLRATTTPWAPWYAIPADSKPFMRYSVAKIVRDTLESMKLRYPAADAELEAKMPELRRRLGG